MEVLIIIFLVVFTFTTGRAFANDMYKIGVAVPLTGGQGFIGAYKI